MTKPTTASETRARITIPVLSRRPFLAVGFCIDKLSFLNCVCWPRPFPSLRSRILIAARSEMLQGSVTFRSLQRLVCEILKKQAIAEEHYATATEAAYTGQLAHCATLSTLLA